MNSKEIKFVHDELHEKYTFFLQLSTVLTVNAYSKTTYGNHLKCIENHIGFVRIREKNWSLHWRDLQNASLRCTRVDSNFSTEVEILLAKNILKSYPKSSANESRIRRTQYEQHIEAEMTTGSYNRPSWLKRRIISNADETVVNKSLIFVR